MQYIPNKKFNIEERLDWLKQISLTVLQQHALFFFVTKQAKISDPLDCYEISGALQHFDNSEKKKRKRESQNNKYIQA